MMEATHDRSDVDGIPVLHAGPVAGRCAGGLLFRVGRADETLATAGITHLVEHLALEFLEPAKVHANGQTGQVLTHFHIEGTHTEVVAHLNRVAAALVDLPIARLDMEKHILRTEASGRSGGPAPNIGLWRYGAQDYGLTSLPELGLAAIDAPAVRRWAADWFTSGNAVAWLATDGDVSDLSLPLPDGQRRTPPVPSDVLPQKPAYFRDRDGVVVVESVVRRSTAAMVYTQLLAQRLFGALRQRAGYSYAATAHYELRDADNAYIVAVADALPEKQDAVVGGVIDELAALRFGAVDPAEIRGVVEKLGSVYELDDWRSLRLPTAAINELLGRPDLSREEHIAELAAIDPAAVAEIAQEAYESALAQVPGAGIEWAGFAEAPVRSPTVVSGDRYPFVSSPEAAIVISDDGISCDAGKVRSTVLWRDVAALEAYPDGARRVIGLDGFQVNVEPTLLSRPLDVLSVIDRRVPAGRIVRAPARDPESVPKTPEPPSSPAPSRPRGGALERGYLRVAVVVLYVLAGLCAFGAIGALSDAAGGATGPDALTWSDFITMVVMAVGIGAGGWALHRVLRRRSAAVPRD